MSDDPQIWRRMGAGGGGVQAYESAWVPVDLLSMCVHEPRVVLDVGCFTGASGQALKRLFPSVRVVGIEPDAEAARRAASILDAVAARPVADVAPADLGLTPGTVDSLVMADVLEHLADPCAALNHLRPWLAADAQVLVSLPNVGNLGIVADLAAGRFTYRPAGILDATHLRFFTRTSGRALLSAGGFVVEQEERAIDPAFRALADSAPAEGEVRVLQAGALSFSDLGREAFLDLLTMRFLYRARIA